MYLSDIKGIFKDVILVSDGKFDNLANVTTAESENCLVYIVETKYLNKVIENPKISCVWMSPNIYKQIEKQGFPGSIGMIVSNNPQKDFFSFHNFLAENTTFYGTREKRYIDDSVKIGPNVCIPKYNVFIEEGVVIEPNVVILENVRIKRRTLVGAGTIIGAEGFEFKFMNNSWKRVSHAGWVIIEKNVELLSNCVVVKGLFPSRNTILQNEVKVDNLVNISHGVKIGKRTRIAAGSVISGSVTIGEDVWIGPGACIRDGITIGNKAIITMGAVVAENAPAGHRVTGNFAVDHKKFLIFLAEIKRQGKS